MATQTEPPTNALYQALSSPEPGTGLVRGPEFFAAKLSRTEAFAKEVRLGPGLTESPR